MMLAGRDAQPLPLPPAVALVLLRFLPASLVLPLSPKLLLPLPLLLRTRTMVSTLCCQWSWWYQYL